MNTIFVDLYRSRITRQWRWRVRNAGNRRIMANGGESYWNYADCLSAVQQLFGPDTIVYKRESEMGDVLVRHPDPWPAA